MISVCLATYNGEKYLKLQLDSILKQLSDKDELIISDDGSTDNTIKIIQSFNDNRIKLLFHKSNPKYSSYEKAADNFENAIKNSKGDYIFLSDQDDIWKDNKVITCLEELKKYDFVYHNMELVNETGAIVKNLCYENNPLKKTWLHLIYYYNLRGCCFSFKRNCLSFILPFPKKVIGHDHWIGILCRKKVLVKYIQEPLISYRVYKGSVSYGKKRSFIFKISYRVKLFFQITKRLLTSKK